MKLDQLSDLERGEILGFIQGYSMAAAADADPLDVEVRTAFPAVSDEADFLDAVAEAGRRMKARGKRMLADADAMDRLAELMRKDEPKN